jgi:hypothetical protein
VGFGEVLCGRGEMGILLRSNRSAAVEEYHRGGS